MRIQIQTTPGGHETICDEFEPCPQGFKSEIFERVEIRTDHPNYPTRTAQDLEIADLKRENNAAFERIQELSEALFNLGYDPTAKRKPCECGNPSQHICGESSDKCCDCGGKLVI